MRALGRDHAALEGTATSAARRKPLSQVVSRPPAAAARGPIDSVASLVGGTGKVKQRFLDDPSWCRARRHSPRREAYNLSRRSRAPIAPGVVHTQPP